MEINRRVVVTFVVFVSVVVAAQPTAAQYTFSPNNITVDGGGTVTVTVSGSPALTVGNTVFLLLNGLNCTTPSATTSSIQSANATIASGDTFVVDPSALQAPATFQVCYCEPNVNGTVECNSVGTVETNFIPPPCDPGASGLICLVTPNATSALQGSVLFTTYPLIPNNTSAANRPYLLATRVGCTLTGTAQTCGPYSGASATTSAQAVEDSTGNITFSLSGLAGGAYYLCYYNNSAWHAAIPTVTVGGAVDPAMSNVTCCVDPTNTFAVGVMQNCTIYLRDQFGVLTGDPSSVPASSYARIYPAVITSEDEMSSTYVTNPTWTATGTYTFQFNATVAGLAQVTFFLEAPSGILLYAGYPTSVVIHPGQAVNATAACTSGPSPTCNITGIDAFGNSFGCDVTTGCM